MLYKLRKRKTDEELYQDGINAYPKRDPWYHLDGFYQPGYDRMESHVK